MKILKKISVVLLLVALSLATTGCYVIRAQTMRNLKGTYKLTTYTYTASYERREGYTPKTINYIEDEEYLYEEYLVVTGTGTGYLVHKDATGKADVKEVSLAYSYSQEDTDKIEYLMYSEGLSVSDASGKYRLGVNGKTLNYSKLAFDYTQLITKKPMRSEDINVRWTKVDRATDLSYVQSQISGLPEVDAQQ